MSEHFTDAELNGLTPEERQVLEEAIADQPSDEGHGQELTEPLGADAATETTPAAPSFFPAYTGPPLQEINAMCGQLDRELEEGDIDLVEYSGQRDRLTTMRVQAELDIAAREQIWRQERDHFFRSNPSYRTDLVLKGALQHVFKTLDTPENSHKTGAQLLEEARSMVEARRQAISEHAGRTGGAGTRGSSDLSHLDHLDGMELESALERLNPEQVSQYLRG